MLYKTLAFSACLFGAMAQQGSMPASIVGTAAATDSLSTLVAVLSDPNYAGVLGALSGAGPFTVFAPTNAAFAKAGVTLDFARANVAAVTDILTYHVLGSQVLSTDLAQGSNFAPSLQGTELRVSAGGGGVEVNGMARVVAADVLCSNGVVHIIDTVLMPIPASIVQTAVATDALSTLVAVLTAPAYQPVLLALSGEGPFTVFAPTNEAFAAAGITADLVSKPENTAFVTRVLQYHVVSGVAAYAGDLRASQSVQTLSGEELAVTKRGGSVTVNGDVSVVIADVQCSNGVVHVIDKVLVPPAEPAAEAPKAPKAGKASKAATVVDRVKATPELATLFSVLGMEGFAPILELLAGEGPFTVFAPSNEAFAAAGVDASDVEAVSAVLAYHVVAENIVLGGSKIADEISYATANGADLTVTHSATANKKGKKRRKMNKLLPTQFQVNGAGVVQGNIKASNGIVHVIDQVLMPPKLPSLVEAAVATPSLSTLVAVLTMPQFAPVLELLSGPGPFTVFAPTNEAFSFLDIDLNDVDAVTAVLSYHVISGAAVKAGALAPEQQVDTLSGGTLSVRKTSSGMVTVNDAHVTAADVLCSNGVVHIVDRVLLPSSAPPSTAVATSSGQAKSITQVQAELNAAIDVGVPLFNAGDELGCYRVYARAVFEVVMTASPGSGTLAAALANSLESSMSSANKAWTLRIAMDEVLRIHDASAAPASGTTSFSVDVATTRWQNVDDTVMGGVSRSQVTTVGGTVTFSGFVTTDSNGGFVTAQTNFLRPVNMNACRGVSLMAKASDTSRYSVELGNGVGRMGPTFEADMYPSTEWSKLDIPFSSFTRQAFGPSSGQNLNKALIYSFGLKKSAFLQGSLQKDPAFTSGAFSLSVKDVKCLV